MKRVISTATVMLITWFFAGSVIADDLIVYPAKGQNKEQMDKDKYECYTWAKEQTGFDPMKKPTATAPPPQQQGPDTRRSVLRGAAVGGAIGSTDGEFGKGAAYGAAAGLLVGGARRRSEQQQQQQWAEEQAAAYAQRRKEYNRAYGACLEAHGYTVK